MYGFGLQNQMKEDMNMKRRNRKLRKALLMISCALALVAISVGATLAYLTDTEAVTNVFTVGQVHIKLDEEKTDANGEALTTSERTDEGNSYKLMPGHTYIKDPTVTVLANSSDAYVRMLVTVNNIADLKAIFPGDVHEGVFLLQNFVSGWDSSEWTFYSATTSGDTCVYEFRYSKIVPASTNDTVLDDLFDTFTLPGDGVTNDDVKALSAGWKLDDAGKAVADANAPALQIDVVAHAIQADGFENDAAGAWEAFNRDNSN